MALRVDKTSLSDLWNKRTLGLVDVDAGGIQRREVHKQKERAFLLDSLARKLPIGALTIYVGDTDIDDPTATWEVIDGKQRLTTIFDYMDGNLIPVSDQIDDMAERNESELPPPPGSQLADAIRDRRYSDLESNHRLDFLSYIIPVYLVNGERQEAVRVFARMNNVSYVLKPQEMRNAIFRGTPILNLSIELADKLNDMQNGETSDLVSMSVISSVKFDRMSDVEFASELLYLAWNNVVSMHRRDGLDQFYQDLMEPDSMNQSKLDESMTKLGEIIPFLKDVLETQNVRRYHFRSPENDFYALVGGFLNQGMPNATQRESRKTILRDEISYFFQAVQRVISEINEGAAVSFEEDQDVDLYARTYLSGQQNSNTRRDVRIGCMARLLSRVFTDVERPFTAYQRVLIWAKSLDKICGRCGQEVDFEDFDAGHIIQRAEGGKSVVDNGRVEHRHCNRSALD